MAPGKKSKSTKPREGKKKKKPVTVLIDENDEEDIDSLIERELKEEEESKRRRMEEEEIEKNASLDLVNEFIQNEARSSFNKQKAPILKKKAKVKKPKEKPKETIIVIEEDTEATTTTTATVEQQPTTSKKKKTKKPKKQKPEKLIKDLDEKEKNGDNNVDTVDVVIVTPKENPIKTAGKKTKKKNKIVPKYKNSIIKTNNNRGNDDRNLDVSFITMILMSISLESEFPALFYKKLFKKKKFREAMRSLSSQQRKLVLAMMNDTSEPDIDYLPIKNYDHYCNDDDYKLAIPT